MAVMRRLNLDYQQPPVQPRRAAGWMLFAAGLAMLLEMGVSYDRLHRERAAMDKEIRTSKLRLDAPRKPAPSAQFTDKDFEEAKRIVERLSAPWEALFSGLESVKNNDVAVLSLEPDMQTGLLRIDGEARDYAAALTLVAQLRAKKAFSDVFLQHNEVKRDDPQHPILFTLTLRWMTPS